MFDAGLTPAGRKGLLAARLGAAAWLLVLVGALFLWAGASLDDENLAPGVMVVGRVCFGLAALPCLAGVLQAAAAALLMPHDAPDLNRGWVYGGFAVCLSLLALAVGAFLVWGRDG